MSKQQARLRILIANAIAAIFAILVFGLTISYAKPSEPTPFLSPIGGGLTPRARLPVVLNNFPPAPTISRYVGNTSMMSTTLFYTLGYSRGQTISTGQKVVIIIDFGYPVYDNTSGKYGAWLLTDHTFHSTDEIQQDAQEFLRGFYYSSPSGISLTLAVGVNNATHPYCITSAVTSAHGVAWAQMINNINSWIVGPPGANWTDKLVAWGAVDAEPYYNTAAATRSWVDGYAHTGQPNYLDFGSCDGCSYTGSGWGSPWQQGEILYMAWVAAGAFPLPEIYLTNGVNADQWYHMSLYAYNTYGAPIVFRGSLTQWNACQEQLDPNSCPSQGTDNMPSQGYMQLYNAINADPHTAQSMPWSSDMSWEK